jgi:hypothetical protein
MIERTNDAFRCLDMKKSWYNILFTNVNIRFREYRMYESMHTDIDYAINFVHTEWHI